MKTSLRCEEVYFLQWEHINGGFCRLVLVLPFQLSVSSAQNGTVPNMFLNFIIFWCRSLKEPLKVKRRSYTKKLPELKTMDRASWFFSTKLVILLAILFFSWFFDYNKTIWLLLFEKYSSRIRKIDIWSQKCGQWTNE